MAAKINDSNDFQLRLGFGLQSATPDPKALDEAGLHFDVVTPTDAVRRTPYVRFSPLWRPRGGAWSIYTAAELGLYTLMGEPMAYESREGDIFKLIRDSLGHGALVLGGQRDVGPAMLGVGAGLVGTVVKEERNFEDVSQGASAEMTKGTRVVPAAKLELPVSAGPVQIMPSVQARSRDDWQAGVNIGGQFNLFTFWSVLRNAWNSIVQFEASTEAPSPSPEEESAEESPAPEAAPDPSPAPEPATPPPSRIAGVRVPRQTTSDAAPAAVDTGELDLLIQTMLHESLKDVVVLESKSGVSASSEAEQSVSEPSQVESLEIEAMIWTGADQVIILIQSGTYEEQLVQDLSRIFYVLKPPAMTGVFDRMKAIVKLDETSATRAIATLARDLASGQAIDRSHITSNGQPYKATPKELERFMEKELLEVYATCHPLVPTATH